MGEVVSLMAIDLGASNGRSILGTFGGEVLKLQKIHGYENTYVNVNGSFYWDVLYLYENVKNGLRQYALQFGRKLNGIGVDSWGLDFGLLDRHGDLLKNPLTYRNPGFSGAMKSVHEIIPPSMLFEKTGVAHLSYNTIYQLYYMATNDDVSLRNAKSLLLMPDLIGFFLTGVRSSEFTNVVTTQLFELERMSWSDELISMIGVERSMFTGIQKSATLKGRLLPEILADTGLDSTSVFNVASHDTASAVAAVPATGHGYAYLSSGTWSLMGCPCTAPIVSETMQRFGFSNEGTLRGGFRLVKNIMGMWILQECRKTWTNEGKNIDWEDLTTMASQADQFIAFVEPNDPVFFGSGDMCQRIRQFCLQSGQRVPDGISEIARVVLESLAMCYRWVFDGLMLVTGRKIGTLHIIGGGSRNRLLNQFAANAIHKPVHSGPAEATAIGNIGAQLLATGQISSDDDLRQIVTKSFTIERYEPKDSSMWDDGYERYLSIRDRQGHR